LPQDHDVSLKSSLTQLKSQNNPDNRLLMKYKDLEYLHDCLKESQTQENETAHLYQLMQLTVLELPKPAPIERTPLYEARMERLRRQADEADYQSMVKNVSGKKTVNESVGKELKQMDSQATFMFNFVLTVLGAFAFGYKAVEYTMATPNTSLQLIVGVTLATIVFFADIYFIIKDYV